MCYNHDEEWRKEANNHTPPLPPPQQPSAAAIVARSAATVEALRGRLAETESRLERARAREAELSRQLLLMKRFVSVMEILESYLKRRFLEQQDLLSRLLSSLHNSS